MEVTAKQLRSRKACENQVTIFNKEWPEGIEITLDTLYRAVELELDLHWFANTFLPAPALETYKKAIAPTAWETYKKAMTPATGETYKKAIASAWETCKKAIASAAGETYEEAVALALYQAILDYEL